MGGRVEEQAGDEDTVLLIQSLQNVVSFYDAEKTRCEIIATYFRYNQRDSYFQRRILQLEKAISKEKWRMKYVAALIQPIREE